MDTQERVEAQANVESQEECADDACDCCAKKQGAGNKAYVIGISALGGLIAASFIYNAIFG